MCGKTLKNATSTASDSTAAPSPPPSSSSSSSFTTMKMTDSPPSKSSQGTKTEFKMSCSKKSMIILMIAAVVSMIFAVASAMFVATNNNNNDTNNGNLGSLFALLGVKSDVTNNNNNNSKSFSTIVLENEKNVAPKRGKVIPNGKFNSKEFYDAYKEIQTEYYQKAFHSNEWRLLTKKDDIEVHMFDHPSDPNCPYVKLKGRIPTSVENCWNYLKLDNWSESMPEMDPFYEGIKIYGEYTHKKVHMILARKRTQRIFAFGKREFVFLSVSDQPLSDGTFVSGTVSVQTSKIPRQVGYTRAFQDSIAFYKPIIINDDNNVESSSTEHTDITIIFRIDLNDSVVNGSGGWFPMWLYVKTIGGTGARSVLNMRNALVKKFGKSSSKKSTTIINENNNNVIKSKNDNEHDNNNEKKKKRNIWDKITLFFRRRKKEMKRKQ